MTSTIRLYRLMQSMLHEYLEPLSEQTQRQLPPGGASSINWILGHLVLGNEYGSNLLGQPTKYLEAMTPIYGPGSKPTDDPAVIVDGAELRRRFDETAETLIGQAESADASTLGSPQPSPFFQTELPTVGDMLQHLMSTHLAVHVGQISQSRREMGLAPLVGGIG